MPGHLEIDLVAHNDRYHDDDPRWLEQIGTLIGELRRATESVHLLRDPVPGTKGAVDQLILSLGSAGVFSVALQVINTCLSRDRHRSVEMTFTDRSGQERTVRVSAENAGRDALAPLIEAATTLARESP